MKLVIEQSGGTMTRSWIYAAAVLAVLPAGCLAQAVCSTIVVSNNMVCTIPQVFGPGGLVLPGGFGPNSAALVGTFSGNSLTPLNSAIATQSVLLPLASPSSGILYSWNSSTKTYSPITDSFGPIFGERADTVGKNRLFVGLSYQFISFSSLDNYRLKNIPEVFVQPDVTDPGDSTRFCSVNPKKFDAAGECAFIRDVVTVQNRVDLKAHQVTAFMTYGVTGRVDVSVAIPIEDIRLDVVSNATIVNLSNSTLHAFTARAGCTPTFQGNCLNQSFPSSSRATGVGDITLRAKATAWKGERSAMAVGANIRVPTGDSLNFLGAGAAGVEPFVVWSHLARIAPHIGAGVEANGSSQVAGDLTTGAKSRLPGKVTYAAGADVWLNKRITTAFDFLGQTLFQTPKLTNSPYQELGACTVDYPTCEDPGTVAPAGKPFPNVTPSTSDTSILSISTGAKVKLTSNLLFTGNIVWKLNDGGLRAKVIPLGEISYTF
jgi:hypothetical protein